MSTEVDRRVTLVGESNPYSSDSGDALLPWPERATGDRLARFLGLTDTQYLEAFDRVNLFKRGEHWSVVVARRRAGVMLAERGGDLVLLGRRVCAAFEGPAMVELPVWSSALRFCQLLPTALRVSGGERLYAVPHPSGLSRAWNEPGAPARLRALLAPFLPTTVAER